ncbi:MAG: hypothetical protein Q4A07_06775 [Coriobacteriales bacterium]|nr:hypothetical protein [Coriobacteriales bacterium]
MEQKCAFETLGTTLVEDRVGKEYRRVFMVDRKYALDVGEYSYGPQTQLAYESLTHHHVVHLTNRGLAELVESCFAAGAEYLTDLMDELDAKGIPYGYLNTIPGKYVAFRPRHGCVQAAQACPSSRDAP